MYKFLLSVVCVAGLSAEMIGGIAVVVKGKVITLQDIKKEIEITKVNEEVAINTLIRQKLEEVEVENKRITVTSGEVYDDIKKTAKQNNMSVNAFYEAALNSNGIDSEELKAKVKSRLLSKKLYSSIAYAQVKQPNDEKLREYYELHKEAFMYPQSFTTVVYQTDNQAALEEKIKNPMFYSPLVVTNEQVLPYMRIAPELAQLLLRTKVNSFTQILPDGRGGFMSFYLKSVQNGSGSDFEAVKVQVQNRLMQELREKVLGDYFARLRHNADITIVRNLY